MFDNVPVRAAFDIDLTVVGPSFYVFLDSPMHSKAKEKEGIPPFLCFTVRHKEAKAVVDNTEVHRGEWQEFKNVPVVSCWDSVPMKYRLSAKNLTYTGNA